MNRKNFLQYSAICLMAFFVVTEPVFTQQGQVNRAKDNPTWKIRNSTLELGTEGKAIKAFKLYEEKRKEPFKSKFTGQELQIEVGKISRAQICSNANYVAHIKREYRNYDEGAYESTTTVQYLNSDGNVKWEKRAVDLDRGVHLADDGRYTLLIQSSMDGCSSELDQDCTKTVVILNNNGDEILKLGPYHTVGSAELTKNGKYGMVGVWPGPKSDDLIILLDVENRKSILKKSKEFSAKGSPRLLENGTVEIVRWYYKDEAHRELDREEIVDRFQIK